MAETAYRYDMIFIDAFSEHTIPSHISSRQFFGDLRRILTDHGHIMTNANVPSNAVYNRIVRTLSSVFEANILFTHTNTIENARVIISGRESCLRSISSKAETIQRAERFEMDAHLEFSLSHLLSFAYRGLIQRLTNND